MIDNSGTNEEKPENNELVEKVEEELAEEEALAEEVVAEEIDPASFVGEINLWSFNDEFDNYMIPIFSEIYPNIKVNHTKIIPFEGVIDEYHQKLESALSTGAGIPDVFVEDYSWIKKIIQYDVWENISAAPYNAEEAAADHFDCVKDFARDSDGNLRALTSQAYPGAIFYRRSMAKEAFGTDDPDEISALMTDMDAFLEMGRTLKDKGIYLIPGLWDLQRLFFLNKTQPWVVDGKLIIEDVVLDYFDVAKTIRDEGLDANLTMWTEEWFAARDADNVFSYIMPTWFFRLEPLPQSFGDWGLAHGPYSYAWGGTWLGISKTSEKKDLAWEFVKCMTTNKDLLRQYAEESSDFFTSDAVLDEEMAATTSKESLVGGQNYYQYFLDEAQRLSNSGWATRVTQYDEDIQSAFMNALVDYVDGNTTRDGAIESFKDSVVQMYPEISVE
jgi:ABC-type glycerol-3-phosphate transport system substrate-binding protein